MFATLKHQYIAAIAFWCMRLIKSMTDQDMTVTVHELEGDVEQRPTKTLLKITAREEKANCTLE